MYLFLQSCVQKDVISLCQILGLSQEPGCVPHELHEVHYQPAFSSLSLHCGVCSARDAAFWRKVSKAFRNVKTVILSYQLGQLSF